jgi:hypothetical protein
VENYAFKRRIKITGKKLWGQMDLKGVTATGTVNN